MTGFISTLLAQLGTLPLLDKLTAFGAKDDIGGLGGRIGVEMELDKADIAENFVFHKDFLNILRPENFFHVDTYIQLGVIAFVIVLGFAISKYLKSKQIYKVFKSENMKKWLRALTNPVIMSVLFVAASTIYQMFMDGKNPVFIIFMNYITAWLIIFRTITNLLGYMLPKRIYTERSERILSGFLWIFFLLWVTGIWGKIIAKTDEVSFTVGSTKLTLHLILSGVFWVVVFSILGLWLSKVIENRLMGMKKMDLNLRIVLSKIIKTLIVFLIVIITLPVIGIDLTVLSVFGGALGVGLGFGLQKIASNYISGFIILLDRSIRVGDRLTIDDFTGYVSKITSRYVVLKGTTGQEAIVPNETFISSTVINESFTDNLLWKYLTVSVAYSTDLPKALNIMREAAACQEGVSKDSPPGVYVMNFGDNGIDLAVGFWATNPEQGFMGVNSRIYLEIWKRFNEAGIEFPFPQREVRILNNEAQDPALDPSKHPSIDPALIEKELMLQQEQLKMEQERNEKIREEALKAEAQEEKKLKKTLDKDAKPGDQDKDGEK